MRKKLIMYLVLLVCILSIAGNAYAAESKPAILEVPDVKIIMDGVITPYKDVPIVIDKSTLLPLRELLVNLGVPDDNEHIIWNSQEKSVIVYKDSTKLYLKQDSKTAYVNDEPVQLDVAPVGYDKNQRMYIPLRFVSNTLEKKVVWDGSINSIIIRDAEEFNQIKAMLDKSNEAMQNIKKCKYTMDMNADFSLGQISMNMGFNAACEVDKAEKAMHILFKMDLLGMNLDSDMYYQDNTSYITNQITGDWEKTVYTEQEYDSLFKESDMSIFDADEALCAGLVMSQAADGDETVLKGDVFLNGLLEKTMAEKGTV